MKKITSLEEAFIHGLSDICSAEKQLVVALPEMAKAWVLAGFSGNLFVLALAPVHLVYFLGFAADIIR